MPISVGLDRKNNVEHYNSVIPKKPSEPFLSGSIRESINTDNIVNSV